MAKEKKMVEAITSMEEDFAQWYTDVVKKAELCDYASVKEMCIRDRADRPVNELLLFPDDLGKGSVRRVVCVSPDLFDGESQAPEDQDHFQLHRLEAAVIVISVFIDHFRAEQALSLIHI